MEATDSISSRELQIGADLIELHGWGQVVVESRYPALSRFLSSEIGPMKPAQTIQVSSSHNKLTSKLTFVFFSQQ